MENHGQAERTADITPQQRGRDQEEQQRYPEIVEPAVPNDVYGTVNGDEHRQERAQAFHHGQIRRPGHPCGVQRSEAPGLFVVSHSRSASRYFQLPFIKASLLYPL